MNKEAILKEIHNSAFKDELEKIALTKSILKGKVKGVGIPTFARQKITDALLGIRNTTRKKAKWAYPYVKGLTNEMAKGKPDIIAAGIGSQALGLGSVFATKGVTGPFPIGSTLTAGYTAITRAKPIISGARQFKRMNKSIPTLVNFSRLKPKYQNLIIGNK